MLHTTTCPPRQRLLLVQQVHMRRTRDITQRNMHLQNRFQPAQRRSPLPHTIINLLFQYPAHPLCALICPLRSPAHKVECHSDSRPLTAPRCTPAPTFPHRRELMTRFDIFGRKFESSSSSTSRPVYESKNWRQRWPTSIHITTNHHHPRRHPLP